MRLVIFFILLFFVIYSHAQEKNERKGMVNFLEGRVVGNDTIGHIYISEVKVPAPWKFKNKRQRKRYSRLVINIKKTLPYARLAKHRLNMISLSLDTIKGVNNRKEFIKTSEKELFNEFEKPLKKLTFSQGRMLIKLIDRETGDTSYALIKDLKGGFTAFMWQSVARIFGSNLKSEYDSDGDDAMIEHIVLLIDNGVL